MNIFSEKNKIASSLFYVIVSALIIIFVTSCSQVTPELSFSDYSVIFDYHDETTLPDARFSLFMASESNLLFPVCVFSSRPASEDKSAALS